eukprot:5710521-Alexandrium_andersonii.AAC.1
MAGAMTPIGIVCHAGKVAQVQVEEGTGRRELAAVEGARQRRRRGRRLITCRLRPAARRDGPQATGILRALAPEERGRLPIARHKAPLPGGEPQARRRAVPTPGRGRPRTPSGRAAPVRPRAQFLEPRRRGPGRLVGPTPSGAGVPPNGAEEGGNLAQVLVLEGARTLEGLRKRQKCAVLLAELGLKGEFSPPHGCARAGCGLGGLGLGPPDLSAPVDMVPSIGARALLLGRSPGGGAARLSPARGPAKAQGVR